MRRLVLRNGIGWRRKALTLVELVTNQHSILSQGDSCSRFVDVVEIGRKCGDSTQWKYEFNSSSQTREIWNVFEGSDVYVRYGTGFLLQEDKSC
ncbi:hypothetical protein TNCV_1414711 [Trichonephila clavipes]|nr:hypothetical protein TNCV_1414711 [Trichonephila clavipes]